MIYSIALDPALDRARWVEKIQPDELSRFVGKELNGLGEILSAAHTVREQGIGIVLVFIGVFLS